MDIGIIGLPQSGKTTVFNALTRGHAEVGKSHGWTEQTHIGVVKVPDPRLEVLTRLSKSVKTVSAEIKYVDFVGPPPGVERAPGFQGEYLLQVSQMDALLVVLRGFQDESLPHPQGKVDPGRDLETMEMELAFSDLGSIERRLSRLDASFKAARATEREALTREQEALLRWKAALEADQPLREAPLSGEEAKLAAGFQFLTAKPLIAAVNTGEEDIPRVEEVRASVAQRRAGRRGAVFALAGKLEAELAQMDEEEAHPFREDMGLKEPVLDQMVRLSFQELGLCTFLTTGPKESRAWTIAVGTPAAQAAGKIHSDLERGFIRAEIVSYDDLVRVGTFAEARRQGLLRHEGKGYIVKDGDIVEFLFNV